MVDNSKLESSQPVSLSSQHNANLNLESSSSLAVDEKLEPQSQKKAIEDSKLADVSDGLSQSAALPTDSTEKSDTKVEQRKAGSPEVQTVLPAHSGDTSTLLRTDSNPSSGVRTSEEDIHNVRQSDEPGEKEVEVAIVQNETPGHSSPSKEEKQVDAGPVIDTSAPFESVKDAASMFGGSSGWKSHKEHTEEKRVLLSARHSFPTKLETAVDAGPVIDTSAPIESVKGAASMFGGITDWKTHKAQTDEKRKTVELQLMKLQGKIPEFKKQKEATEDAKSQVLNELDSTKRLIEELKLNLERAQTEENQAKQDSELAKLRAEEVEQGITDEASVASKTQFEVAKARHATAVEELKSVKYELEKLQAEYSSLVVEKDLAVKKAEETVSTSKKVERTVEELTIELIATKESLESAHTAHMEAEDQILKASEAKEQDSLNWEKELKQAERELQNLNQQLLLKKNLESRLETTSTILHNLQAEYSAYAEDKPNQEHDSEGENLKAKNENELHLLEAVASAKRELEDVKLNIIKATEEVNYLKVASVSLTAELEREKSELATVKQRERTASLQVASLEAYLNRTKLELALAQIKEKEAREKMVDVPNSPLQEAAEEAEEAKSLVLLAQEGLRKAKEESELVKTNVNTVESRLRAIEKEIEAARASERLALAAAKALEESDLAGTTDGLNGVTLPIEEYNALSQRAREAEEQVNMRVLSAISQLEMAKESELRSLEELDKVNKEKVVKKEELKIAAEKADKAKEGKLGIEQELRNWRDETAQRRMATDAGEIQKNTLEERTESKSSNSDATPYAQSETSSKVSTNDYNTDSSSEVKVSRKKRKKSLFPRIIMYLSRRKSLSPKLAIGKNFRDNIVRQRPRQHYHVMSPVPDQLYSREF